jgi:hypothetical protein
MSDSNINLSINNLYKGESYIDIYNTDIFITFILCLVFFIAISYFYVMNNIKPIIANWDKEKCSPSVMPFAGLINNGPNTTKLEFTTKNFSSCMHTMIGAMAADAFQPVYYIMNAFSKMFKDLSNVLNDVRAEFDKIRITIQMFTKDVMGRTMNFVIPFVSMIIGVKSMLAKVNGILGAIEFTLFGTYMTLKSIFGVLIEVVNDILIGLVVTITAAFILAIFFPPAMEVALGSIVIMGLILVPMTIVRNFADEVMGLHTSAFPGIPSCFSANTLIRMSDDTIKKISEINPGDMLYGINNNDTKVTAILKCSALNQTIYNLDNVIVTGEHRVLHDEKGWIKVKEHEASVLVKDFKEPFVYCLNTDSKSFQINNTIFSDWDDIDEDIMNKLNSHIKSEKDIHLNLENGLDGNLSILNLEDGTAVLLKNIKVNDILNNGEKVVGVIKIDMTDIKDVYDYYLETTDGSYIKTLIRGTRNIQLILDDNVKKNMIENKQGFKAKNKEKYFYQLLVEGGSFIVNGIRVGDYNTGIDKFILF